MGLGFESCKMPHASLAVCVSATRSDALRRAPTRRRAAPRRLALRLAEATVLSQSHAHARAHARMCSVIESASLGTGSCFGSRALFAAAGLEIGDAVLVAGAAETYLCRCQELGAGDVFIAERRITFKAEHNLARGSLCRLARAQSVAPARLVRLAGSRLPVRMVSQLLDGLYLTAGAVIALESCAGAAPLCVLEIAGLGDEAAAVVRFCAGTTDLLVDSPPSEVAVRGPHAGVLELECAPPESGRARGMDEPLARLRSLLSLCQTGAAPARRLGISLPSGALLVGPDGVGKRTALRTAAGDTGCAMLLFDCARLAGLERGAGEQLLRSAFAEAHARARRESCLVALFLRRVDLAGATRAGGGSAAREAVRLTTQLLTLMDGAARTACDAGFVLVFGSTSDASMLDSALRRPGRFEIEIGFAAPGASDREAILAGTLGTCADAAVLHELSQQTVGYVGADLRALVGEASLLSATGVPEASDFARAMRVVLPSLRRDAALRQGRLPREEGARRLAGLDDVQRQLAEIFEWPRRFGQLFRSFDLADESGLLLHGPPGCAKTSLVRSLAARLAVSFYSLSGAELYSSYLGEAERALRELFAQARATRPSLLFIDELDALVGTRTGLGAGDSGEASESGDRGVRERILATLLTELDGVGSTGGVLVVGATNRLDLIDPALLRPGRLGTHIAVPLPDASAREAILRLYAARTPLADDVDLHALAAATHGASGADLEGLIREAALRALERDMNTSLVTRADIERASDFARA